MKKLAIGDRFVCEKQNCFVNKDVFEKKGRGKYLLKVTPFVFCAFFVSAQGVLEALEREEGVACQAPGQNQDVRLVEDSNVDYNFLAEKTLEELHELESAASEGDSQATQEWRELCNKSLFYLAYIVNNCHAGSVVDKSVASSLVHVLKNFFEYKVEISVYDGDDFSYKGVYPFRGALVRLARVTKISGRGSGVLAGKELAHIKDVWHALECEAEENDRLNNNLIGEDTVDKLIKAYSAIQSRGGFLDQPQKVSLENLGYILGCGSEARPVAMNKRLIHGATVENGEKNKGQSKLGTVVKWGGITALTGLAAFLGYKGYKKLTDAGDLVDDAKKLIAKFDDCENSSDLIRKFLDETANMDEAKRGELMGAVIRQMKESGIIDPTKKADMNDFVKGFADVDEESREALLKSAFGALGIKLSDKALEGLNNEENLASAIKVVCAGGAVVNFVEKAGQKFNSARKSARETLNSVRKWADEKLFGPEPNVNNANNEDSNGSLELEEKESSSEQDGVESTQVVEQVGSGNTAKEDDGSTEDVELEIEYSDVAGDDLTKDDLIDDVVTQEETIVIEKPDVQPSGSRSGGLVGLIKNTASWVEEKVNDGIFYVANRISPPKQQDKADIEMSDLDSVPVNSSNEVQEEIFEIERKDEEPTQEVDVEIEMRPTTRRRSRSMTSRDILDRIELSERRSRSLARDDKAVKEKRDDVFEVNDEISDLELGMRNAKEYDDPKDDDQQDVTLEYEDEIEEIDLGGDKLEVEVPDSMETDVSSQVEVVQGNSDPVDYDEINSDFDTVHTEKKKTRSWFGWAYDGVRGVYNRFTDALASPYDPDDRVF